MYTSMCACCTERLHFSISQGCCSRVGCGVQQLREMQDLWYLSFTHWAVCVKLFRQKCFLGQNKSAEPPLTSWWVENRGTLHFGRTAPLSLLEFNLQKVRNKGCEGGLNVMGWGVNRNQRLSQHRYELRCGKRYFPA